MKRPVDREGLKGVYVFCVTPFKASEQAEHIHTAVDEDGLRRNVRFLMEHKVRLLIPCGGTGEFASLDWDEYCRVVRLVREEAGSDAVVMPGVGFNLDQAIRMAQYAQSVGCEGVMVFPPAVPPSEEGLFQFHRLLAENTHLALMTYATSTLSLSFLQKLAQLDRVVIIKDSTANLGWSRRMIDATHDRLLWICEGEAIAPYYFLHSLDGVTTGIANFHPDLTLRMYEAARAGDLATAVDIQRQLEPLNNLRGKAGNHAPVVKAAMDMLGLAGGVCRPPLLPLGAAEQKELAAMLRQFGLLKE